MSLANKVTIALVLGIVIGLVINYLGYTQTAWVQSYLINGVFEVGGKLFVNALKMLVVPLVLFSLIPGILGIGDIKLLGKVGGKAFLLYLLTTALAIILGITIAALLGIGEGMNIAADASFVGKQADKNFIDIIIGIVPSNIVAAMANAEMLAIIFFSIFFGIAMLMELDQVGELSKVIDQLNRVVLRMVELVMLFAPYAVFCLVAKAVAELGLDLLANLASYFVVVIMVLILHVLVTQMTLLKLMTGLSIKTFLEKMRAAQLFAFGTSSSAATIPVTLRTAQQRLGVDRGISSFTIPFGATINMDGTAIMQGVVTVFIANLYGIELGLGGYTLVVATAVLASIGTAAVPSVGLVMLTLVFEQVGLPVEAIGIVYGVDRLVDMTRTAVNVTGDAVVTTIVAHSENKLDLSVYNDPDAGHVDTHVHIGSNQQP